MGFFTSLVKKRIREASFYRPRKAIKGYSKSLKHAYKGSELIRTKTQAGLIKVGQTIPRKTVYGWSNKRVNLPKAKM